MSKTCNFCKINLPLDSFHNCKKGAKGKKSKCISCAREWNAKYYRDNKLRIDIRNAKYDSKNQYKKNARTAKYRAKKNRATPKWLTEEMLQEIKNIYQDASDLQWLNEEPLHVDHIVPIRGNNVSGLHVPWNLQILTSSKNISKGNRL
jgi:5-methylcytosine-specific restriction endonuclease McrA